MPSRGSSAPSTNSLIRYDDIGISFALIKQTSSLIGTLRSLLPGMRYPFSWPPSNHFVAVREATLQIRATSPIVSTFFPFATNFPFFHRTLRNTVKPTRGRSNKSPTNSSPDLPDHIFIYKAGLLQLQERKLQFSRASKPSG